MDLARIVAEALHEDVGTGDVTTLATVRADARTWAVVRQKAPGAIAGLDAVEEVFRQLDRGIRIERLVDEGIWRDGGEVLRVEGATRAILMGERTALNFLGRLSGVATAASRAMQTVEGTGAIVIDTRKTTPGLRLLEKAAVKAGGASNHRFGLHDVILLKENHVTAAGGITAAIELARAAAPDLELQVEARNHAEIEEALAAGAPRLLLDNMTPAQLRDAVALVAGRATLEASGGITQASLRETAESGVNWVSLGALTHSSPALDVSLILEPLD